MIDFCVFVSPCKRTGEEDLDTWAIAFLIDSMAAELPSNASEDPLLWLFFWMLISFDAREIADINWSILKGLVR